VEVYEVDPFLCPRCGGTMEVVAGIERPAVVRQILDHLGLPPQHPASEPRPTSPTAAWPPTPGTGPTNRFSTSSPSRSR